MIDTVRPNQWYYSTHGRDYGPVSWSIIESMVRDDRLSLDDLVVQEGQSNYVRIEQVIQGDYVPNIDSGSSDSSSSSHQSNGIHNGSFRNAAALRMEFLGSVEESDALELNGLVNSKSISELMNSFRSEVTADHDLKSPLSPDIHSPSSNSTGNKILDSLNPLDARDSLGSVDRSEVRSPKLRSSHDVAGIYAGESVQYYPGPDVGEYSLEPRTDLPSDDELAWEQERVVDRGASKVGSSRRSARPPRSWKGLETDSDLEVPVAVEKRTPNSLLSTEESATIPNMPQGSAGWEQDQATLLDLPMLIFGLQIGAVWSLICAAVMLVCAQFGSPFSPLVWFLISTVTLIFVNVLSATGSRMHAEEFEEGAAARTSRAWDFVLERVVGLSIGPVFVALAAGSIVAVTGTAISVLSHLAGIGPFLGSLLLLPTFVLVAGAILALIATLMLPVILGVENCGPGEANTIWTRQIQSRPVQMLLDIVFVLSKLAPSLLLFLIIAQASLGFSLYLTTEFKWLSEFQFGLSTLLTISSIFLVLGSWLSFAVLLTSSKLAALYMEQRRQNESQ